MRERAHQRLRLEADLRRAVEQGGIDVADQPTVDLGTGRPVGVEACYDRGVNCYVVKPLDLDDFTALIDRFWFEVARLPPRWRERTAPARVRPAPRDVVEATSNLRRIPCRAWPMSRCPACPTPWRRARS